MTLKSSWIVLLSFTISAFIKKIHFIFFQKVNWKNLSRKTITGKRIRSSHLQPWIIAKFIPQNRGNQTWPTPRGQTSNKGDATDTDLWHSWMFRCLFNFPSSRKQVAAHTKAHVDGEPFTPSSFPRIPEPHSILLYSTPMLHWILYHILNHVIIHKSKNWGKSRGLGNTTPEKTERDNKLSYKSP